MKTKLLCKYCGSDNITSDASAVWNGYQWDLLTEYDDKQCQDCGQSGNNILTEVIDNEEG